jgi:hypothetical protein
MNLGIFYLRRGQAVKIGLKPALSVGDHACCVARGGLAGNTDEGDADGAARSGF